MAKRNLRKIISKTEIPEKYQLGMLELNELAAKDPWDMIMDSFKAGFALGMRYQKKKEGDKTDG